MSKYTLYIKIIGSQNIPKFSCTAWVGTTPIGFAKKGDLNFDNKKGYHSSCFWTANIKTNYKDLRAEILLKHHKVIGGESEAGNLLIPLNWLPLNRVVTDWFPVVSRFVKGINQQPMLINVQFHLTNTNVPAFKDPPGSLLVAPAWDRPGLPAVPPTRMAPSYSIPQNAAQQGFPGYPPQQMPPQQVPPQQMPHQQIPPQQMPHQQMHPQQIAYPPQQPNPYQNPMPQQPYPYPMQTQSQPSFPQYPQSPQPYYNPAQQVPVIADSTQPVFAPPFMHSPTVTPTVTPTVSPENSQAGSANLPSCPPPDQQFQPIYMPPPQAMQIHNPNEPNPYDDIDPSELPSSYSNGQLQQNQNQQSSNEAYPTIPIL